MIAILWTLFLWGVVSIMVDQSAYSSYLRGGRADPYAIYRSWYIVRKERLKRLLVIAFLILIETKGV